MKYQTVIAASLADFDKKINELIAKDWKLQGGVSVATHITDNGSEVEAHVFYAQGMVLEELGKHEDALCLK
jgi:hypothetical protein